MKFVKSDIEALPAVTATEPQRTEMVREVPRSASGLSADNRLLVVASCLQVELFRVKYQLWKKQNMLSYSKERLKNPSRDEWKPCDEEIK